MLAVLALLFLVVPVVEIYLIVQVSAEIGFGSTLFVLIAVSIVGAWLVKYQGISVIRRVQRQLQQGSLPTDAVIDGGLVLLAGVLMLTPGFLTDAVGLILLVPPTRAVVRSVLKRRYSNRLVASGTTFTTHSRQATSPGEIWDVESWENDTGTPPRELP